MSGYGRVPGCRAGKRLTRIGKNATVFLSKTGHSPPQQVALRLKPRRRRATWGGNVFRVVTAPQESQ